MQRIRVYLHSSAVILIVPTCNVTVSKIRDRYNVSTDTTIKFNKS